MITALLVACRDTIRAAINLPADSVLVQNDGKPPPTCGDRFVAVFGRDWRPGTFDQNQGIDAYGDITVAVTFRMVATPYDIRGQEIYIRKSLDVENLLNVINRNIHQSYGVITRANTLLEGTDKIIEPLRWAGGDAQPRLVDADWFTSDADDRNVGLVQEIHFSQARRMQTLANMR